MIILCAAIMSLLIGVDCHFSMTTPPARARDFNPIPGNQNGIDDPKFICGGHDTPGTKTAITAGGTTDFALEAGPANHCGDCSLYLSYDVAKAAADQEYFRVDNLEDYIKEGTSFQKKKFTLPAWLPNGDAIFRVQCYTLHQGPPEYYSYCSDVTISGGKAGGAIPKAYKVVGHMPKTGYGSCSSIVRPIGPAMATDPGGAPVMTPAPTTTGGTMAPTRVTTGAPTTTKIISTPAPTAPPPAVTGPTAAPAQGQCIDQKGEEVNCGKLKDQGLCETFTEWMTTHCAKTCEACTKDINVCTGDKNRNCGYWANTGECISNPVWMKDNCPLACGYCLANIDNSALQIKQTGIVWLLLAACLVYVF